MTLDPDHAPRPHWRPHGETHHRAKLTNKDIRLIRWSADTYRALAQRHGCSPATIYRIRALKAWKHI